MRLLTWSAIACTLASFLVVGCSGIDEHVAESERLRAQVTQLETDLSALRERVPELQNLVAGIEAQASAAASEMDMAVTNDPSLGPALANPRARMNAIGDLVLEAKIRFPELAEMIRKAESDAGLARMQSDRVVAGAQQIQQQAALFNAIPQMLGLGLPNINLGGISSGLRRGADLLDAGRPTRDPSPSSPSPSNPWSLALGLMGVAGSVGAGGYGVYQSMQGKRRQDLATQTNVSLSLPGMGQMGLQAGINGQLQSPMMASGVYAAPQAAPLPQAPSPMQMQAGFQAGVHPAYIQGLPAAYHAPQPQPPQPQVAFHAQAGMQPQGAYDRVATEPVPPDLAQAQQRGFVQYAQQQNQAGQSGAYPLPRQA